MLIGKNLYRTGIHRVGDCIYTQLLCGKCNTLFLVPLELGGKVEPKIICPHCGYTEVINLEGR